MTRKRDRYTRLRARRSRYKTPPPTDGWLMTELSAITQISLTSLRYYALRRLIQPIQFRGTATRYARRELLRLLALRRMKTEGKPTLEEIKRRLDAWDDAALEQWVAAGPISSSAAVALGIAASNAERAAPETVMAIPRANAREGNRETREGAPMAWPEHIGSARVETWYRVPLLPGLALIVSSTASVLARSTARRIFEENGVVSSGEREW